MNTKQRYEKLKGYLESNGCTIHMGRVGVGLRLDGRYYKTYGTYVRWEQKRSKEGIVADIWDTIRIRREISDEEKLLTLLHEGGHWLSEFRYWTISQRTYFSIFKDAEKRAYLYGWRINKDLGLNISKSKWRKSHSTYFKTNWLDQTANLK